MERLGEMAAEITAAFREKAWLVVKFSLLFSFVTWFAYRVAGELEIKAVDNLIIGILAGTAVTAFSLIHGKIFDEVSDAFLDVEEEDDAREKGKKTAITILKKMFYVAQDYGLAALSVALVVVMKKYGFSYLATVFVLLLVIDLPSSAALVITYERTGKDLTLGRSYRRMADAIYSHSKLAGMFVFAYETTMASFWSGPDLTVMFFRDEFKTRKLLVLALLSINTFHAFLWTAVYQFGYEDIIGLAKNSLELLN